MKLKKVNAVLGLLVIFGLVVHVGYNIFAYMTMYYNPTLKILTAAPFMICVCLHAICGMCAVFLQGDGTRMDIYGKQNRATIIQRVSAALLFPLLILHLNGYKILQSLSEEGNCVMFAVVMLLNVFFFLAVAAHIATSFSKAFITLGLLQDRKKQQTIDRIAYVLCTVMFIIAAVVVVRGDLIMFVPK